MLFLCDAAIEYALTQCVARPDYRVLVATTVSHFRDIKNNLNHNRHFIISYQAAERIIQDDNSVQAEFPNGSKFVLYGLTDAENLGRGRRVNLLVVDEELDNFNMLQRLESLYYPYVPQRGQRASIAIDDWAGELFTNDEANNLDNSHHGIDAELSLEEFNKIIGK